MNRALIINPTETGQWPIRDGNKPVRFQSLSQFFCGPDWKRNAMRGYSDHLLIWVTRGQGRMILSGVRSGYNSHNAIFVPAGTMLKFECGSQCYGTVMRISSALHVGLPQHPMHLRVRNAIDQCELTGHLEVLQQELDSRRARSERAAICLLGLVSVWLERQSEEGPKSAAAHNPEAVEAVNAYTSAVEANYASGKGIADYASDLGHTPADLTRYCKELCDLSASDILNQRIHYAAQEALSDGKVSFQQVAEDLGFSSPAYFTRSFENVTGESPERFCARTSAA